MAPSRAERPKMVFVEDFVELPCPPAEIRKQLLSDGEWLAPLANAAVQDAEALRLRAGPSWHGGRIARDVRARVLGVRDREDTTIFSLVWHSARHPSIFPVLEGDLELAPIGGVLCRVTFSAAYVPPVGEPGPNLDTAYLHRVGQSLVRSFLQRLAKCLMDAYLIELRLEPLVEYRLDPPVEETGAPTRSPHFLHLAHPNDKRTLCGYERTAFDTVGAYIWDGQFQCSACWAALVE